MRALEHITLATGHTRRSPRSEVGPGIVEALWPLIDRALTGEPAPIPPGDGYMLTGGVQGRCASFTVWSASTMLQPDDTEAHRAPIVEIGVAGHSRCGALLWRTLHEMAARLAIPLATDPARCPPEPWCAALLYPVGVIGAPHSMDWLGDFERCLAWAWLEYHHPREERRTTMNTPAILEQVNFTKGAITRLAHTPNGAALYEIRHPNGEVRYTIEGETGELIGCYESEEEARQDWGES